MNITKTKMKRIAAALYMLAISQIGIAQNFEWVKQIGGLNEKQSSAIAVDGSGSIIVTGWFRGTVDFDPGPDTLNLTSAGGSDIFICKLNSQGNLIWAKSLVNSEIVQNDNAHSVAIDNVGNIYISGGFWGTIVFDSSPDTLSLTSTEESANFICKFDASGNFLWAREYGVNISKPNTVAVDNDNNVYLAGRSEGMIDVDSIVNLDYEYNLFVVKFNPTGNLLWENVWVNYFWDMGSSIFLDSEGNAYITGSYFARTDFDPGEGTFYLSDMDDNDQMPDVFIVKLDSSGNLVWAKQIGGEELQVGGPCVVDSFGNIYFYGLFSSETDFDPGPEVYNLNLPRESVCLVKLNNLGNLIWAKPIAGEIGPGSIAIDEQANIYLTGFFSGTVDFDINESVISYESFWSDIFVTKWDSAGNFKWCNRLKGADEAVSNYGWGLAIHNSEIYATGTFEGTINAEINSNEQSFTSQGQSDIVIYKISQLSTFHNNYYTESTITYYPNPTTDKLNVVFGKIHPVIAVSVKNILGQDVFTEKFRNVENFQLSMDGFKPGIYFIHLTDKNEQKAVLKVLKE